MAGETVLFGEKIGVARIGATPLNYYGAGNGDRTRDPRLGKPMLYQLSYARFFPIGHP